VIFSVSWPTFVVPPYPDAWTNNPKFILSIFLEEGGTFDNSFELVRLGKNRSFILLEHNINRT
jgi:hypothetical protein